MVAPLSIRLPDTIAAKVRTLAALEHRSQAEMLRLLAEEALKQREFPDIVFVNGPTGRRATFIQGPEVWAILEPYLLAGRDWEALVASYPDLDQRLLHTALAYYETYPDEIDARITLNQTD
jgi:uncharacterized protein (DUF433 family)/predicted transcriptional regulator